MEINLVRFNTDIGKTKPQNMTNDNVACPFCDVEHLENIIDTDGNIIFLKNKYIVIEGADQFVLIEGDNCHADMPDYTREHMHRIIRFGIKHWRRLLDSGKYEEVLFFKSALVISLSAKPSQTGNAAAKYSGLSRTKTKVI